MEFRDTGPRIGEPELNPTSDHPLALDQEFLEGQSLEGESMDTRSEERGASVGEDPVRAYLHDIGKVRLLTAAQEVEIGRRIEDGQTRLWRALAAIPLVVHALGEVGDKLRRGAIPVQDLIVLPEGGELEGEKLKLILRSFARLSRLRGETARLHKALRGRQLLASTRRSYARWIAANREAI